MFLKPYKSLVGYLERYTILKIKKIHVRIHHIKSPDKTPFKHSHPFHYVSFVYSGGYEEEVNGQTKTHTAPCIIVRRDKTFHRIMSVLPNTKTLFFTWKTGHEWIFDTSKLYKAPGWVEYVPGVYKRIVFGKTVWSKFDKFWHRGHLSYADAEKENLPSIDQTTKGSII